MPVIHLEKVPDLIGFAMENVKGGNSVLTVTQVALTSDHPIFYQYIEKISNTFLNKTNITIDSIYRFLVIIHQDLSADLYINDFQMFIDIMPKRSVKKGEVIFKEDIANIHKVKFPQIVITENDKVIYCFKAGWRFGLFFDLSQRVKPTSSNLIEKAKKLDVEKMMVTIGYLYRRLYFWNVYNVLESGNQFDILIKNGWFPFVEILTVEYGELNDIFQSKFDLNNRIQKVVNSFTADRIKKITERWWSNQIFFEKKSLIMAGITAYLQNTSDGFVNCIKNLWTEIEGILRNLYFDEKGKGNDIKSNELIQYIVEKAKNKTGSSDSLLLPLPFLKYLQSFMFPKFNIGNGNIDMSRHTSSHGVAKATQYTKEHALQLILLLDQIYFYI